MPVLPKWSSLMSIELSQHRSGDVAKLRDRSFPLLYRTISICSGNESLRQIGSSIYSARGREEIHQLYTSSREDRTLEKIDCRLEKESGILSHCYLELCPFSRRLDLVKRSREARPSSRV